jgi:hypothetical protein
VTVTVRYADREVPYPRATRVSTDEHNNLEIWSGHDGDDLLYICATGQWIEVTVEEEETES